MYSSILLEDDYLVIHHKFSCKLPLIVCFYYCYCLIIFFWYNYSIVCNIPVNNQFCSIETLTGNNYKQWKSDVELALGLVDVDIALIGADSPKTTDNSTTEQKAYYYQK